MTLYSFGKEENATHWPARSDAVHHATVSEIRVQNSLLVLSLREDRLWFKNNVFQCLREGNECSSTPSGRPTLL